MSHETKIAQNVSIGLKIDDEIERSTLTIRLALSGTVTASERSFEWHGLREAADAEMVATLARWSLGRDLAWVSMTLPYSIVANQNGDNWDVTVSWRPTSSPDIVVKLSEFTSLNDAIDDAQAAIKEVISLLVPPKDMEHRRALVNNLDICSPGAWAKDLLNSKNLIHPC